MLTWLHQYLEMPSEHFLIIKTWTLSLNGELKSKSKFEGIKRFNITNLTDQVFGQDEIDELFSENFHALDEVMAEQNLYHKLPLNLIFNFDYSLFSSSSSQSSCMTTKVNMQIAPFIEVKR